MGRRRRLECLNDFKRALKKGFGTGERERYVPWLRVQDVNSRGVSSKIQGIKINRVHHCLSRHETNFFYIAEYCDGVIDIREQFPLLPLESTIKVANHLGIEHPIVPKNKKQPNVMTTDFLLTVCSEGKTKYIAVNVKSYEDICDERIQEKIEIERVWWNLVGVEYRLYVDYENTQILARNIEWLTDSRRYDSNPLDYSFEDLKDCFSPGIYPIEELCLEISERISITKDEAKNVIKDLAFNKIINIRLDYPIEEENIIYVIEAVKDFSIDKVIA